MTPEQRTCLADAERREDTLAAAALLWSSPADPELLAAVDALASRVNVDAVAPLQLGMAASASVFRARLLAAQGNIEEAIWLLLQTIPAGTPVACLHWARDWLSASPAVSSSLDVRALLSVVDGLHHGAGHGTALWSALADILLELCAAHGEQHGLLPALVRTLARAARHREAARYAAQAYAQDPGYTTAEALARALRRAGDVEPALAAYAQVREHAPDQPGPLLEMGDTLLAAGRHAEALARYEAFLAIAPDHPGAAASACYVRLRLGDHGGREDLLRTWVAHPQHPRCRQLARETTPGVGYMLSPWEVLVRYARDLSRVQLSRMRNQARLQRPPWQTDGPLCCRIVLERPEAPSAQQLIRGALYGTDLSVSIDAEGIPFPDPRAPRAQDLRWLLWTYAGDNARPGLPPPTAPELARIVSSLAEKNTSLDDVAKAGAWLGRRCAPSIIEPLLATMLHPPPPPLPPPSSPSIDGARWLKQVQRVCAATIAFVGQGWDGSPRREALRALILGPSDWTVAAGAWAAVALAEADGTGAAETLDWILARLREEPVDVFCGQTYPLALAALFHPSMSAEGRQSLLPVIQRAEAMLLA